MMDVLKPAYLLSRLSCTFTMDLSPHIQDFSLSFQGQSVWYELETSRMKEFDKNLNALCCFLMAVAYFSALLQHLVLNSGLVCNYSPRQRILNHHHYYHRQHHHRHRHRRSRHRRRHHQHHNCYHHHRGRHVIRSRKRKIAEELWMRLNLKCRELWCRSLSLLKTHILSSEYPQNPYLVIRIFIISQWFL